ncbi:unnamed protein product [Polarella glacialis]|uniref:Uncharacterized protein n=2 Tax=Polarella glacialis TaxID=89957 RepID=A0A813JYH3_POLGL|nr:unnamed protein product [Polarella glacialis]CAE8641642.1 unnamed protein product [Polarella glacialis]CAE8689655.1 unnamed protein product [Polarella glacialis]
MVGLHLGIYLLQSGLIGFFFIPNVATYVLGFGANLRVGEAEWWLAVATVGLPMGYVVLARRLLPENWPLTPFALFGWSGRQWDALFETLVTGKTRLVLSSGLLNGPQGLRIVSRSMRDGGRADGFNEEVVYCCWDVCLGDTTVHNDMLDALDFETLGTAFWDSAAFVQKVTMWLSTNRRVIELKAGRPLLCAHFIRMGEDGRVDQILA